MIKRNTKKSSSQGIFCLFCLLVVLCSVGFVHFHMNMEIHFERTPQGQVPLTVDFIAKAKQQAMHLENAHADQLSHLQSQLQNLLNNQQQDNTGADTEYHEELYMEHHENIHIDSPRQPPPPPQQFETLQSTISTDRPPTDQRQIPSPLRAASTWKSATHVAPNDSGKLDSVAHDIYTVQEATAESVTTTSSSSSSTTTSSSSSSSPQQFMFHPVVTIMAHNRPEYLEKTLSKLISLVQDGKREKRPIEWTVCVSLDSPRDFQRMTSKINQVTTDVRKQSSGPVSNVKDIMQVINPIVSDCVKVFEFSHGGGADALIAISKHVKFAMDSSFQMLASDNQPATHVVLLEEDLMPASDFLFFFESTAWLLGADDTLWCVSAWNDNGSSNHAKDESLLFRTNYFPGLGWMIKREDWVDDLSHRWPKAATTGWDHWIRRSTNNKNRECVFPEVPRTKHIANHGTNVGAAEQKRYEKFGFSNMVPSHSSFGDLSYLRDSNYHSIMLHIVGNLPRNSNKNHLRRGEGSGGGGGGAVVLYSREKYADIAREYNLSPGEARAYSHGIISVRKGSSGGSLSVSIVDKIVEECGKDIQSAATDVENAATSLDSVKHFITKILTSDRIFLIDQRQGAEFLTNQESMLPNPQAMIVTAPKGASCYQRCLSSGKKCVDSELEFVNNCESLLNHFPCEGGCGHQIGLEIPVYVSDPHAATYKQCLVTEQKMPKCSANHKHTSRLCSCV